MSDSVIDMILKQHVHPNTEVLTLAELDEVRGGPNTAERIIATIQAAHELGGGTRIVHRGDSYETGYKEGLKQGEMNQQEIIYENGYEAGKDDAQNEK